MVTTYHMTPNTLPMLTNQCSFQDATDLWYEAIVTEMGSRMVISGRGEGIFDGGADITRAEFSAILVRALGLPAQGVSQFADVSADAWYAGAIGAAYEYGLVNGKGDNRFDPNAKITRQEAMQMVYNATKLVDYAGKVGSLDAFQDTASVSD